MQVFPFVKGQLRSGGKNWAFGFSL